MKQTLRKRKQSCPIPRPLETNTTENMIETDLRRHYIHEEHLAVMAFEAMRMEVVRKWLEELRRAIEIQKLSDN